MCEIMTSELLCHLSNRKNTAINLAANSSTPAGRNTLGHLWLYQRCPKVNRKNKPESEIDLILSSISD